MKKRLILLVLSLLVTSASYAAESQRLRLYGSNTVGAQLGPALVKGWLQQNGYQNIRAEVVAAQQQAITAVAPGGETLVVEIAAHGSSTGFKALEAGKADIAMSSRPIKEKELKRLIALGQMNGPQSEFVVGLDGIAVVVHRDNPLQRIDKGVLRQIFSGQITNWSQLGGDAAPIQVYARDNNSGTYDTFKSLVLGKKHPLVESAKRFESNADLSDAVAVDRNGIGFVGLPYIR